VIDSYFKVMFLYVFDDAIGPWSRVVREPEESESKKEKASKSYA